MKRTWRPSKIEREMTRKALRNLTNLERQKKAVAERVAQSVKRLTGGSSLDG